MLDETYAAILECNKEIADLKAEIQHLRSERERELGNDMLKVLHDCSVSAYVAVKAERDELRSALDFHPRAEKLMRKEKPFLVVSIDEPYFVNVYDLIRANEMNNNSWSDSDEWNYQRLIDDAKPA